MKFAVIQTGGKQYVVEPGQVLRVEKLPEAAEGSKVTFKDVLLVEEGDSTKVGMPTVAGASVEAELVKNGRSKKVTVVKYKAKARYQKKNGHRQPFSEVKITKISA